MRSAIADLSDVTAYLASAAAIYPKRHVATVHFYRFKELYGQGGELILKQPSAPA